MKRICRVCKQEKELEEFTKHKKMHLGYDTICKECNRAHARKWEIDNPEKYKLKCKRWYRAHIKEAMAQRKERYEELTRIRESFKEGKSCSICGYNKMPQILHFHHRDETNKKFDIGNVANLGVSIEHLKEEIEKCDLLCPNCHYGLHHEKNKENKEKNKPIY
jgi:hypothetical protein